MANPAATPSYSYLMDPTYRNIFFNRYEKAPSYFDKVFNISTVTKGNWIAEAELSPLGAARVIPQGNPVEFDAPVQGNPLKKYFTKYGLGFQVVEELQDDDLTGLVSQLPNELAVSLAYSRELTAWDLFNNGHTAALYSGKDGLAIFATNHPLLKVPGVTLSNTVSAGTALSETALQSALDQITMWTDEANRFQVWTPEYLVVPPKLDWMGRQLLKTSGQPFSADNTINATTDRFPGIKLLTVPFLTSTTKWFILCSVRDLRYTWRKTARFQSGDDFGTGNALFKTSARWVVYAYDWRGSFMNPGA